MPKVWCWRRSVRRRSWPWHKKPYLSGAESRHEPWSCRELGNPLSCQVPAERDMCAYGCIFVAAVAAPRPLFITSWCLRATGRRFRPRREECLSLSLSLAHWCCRSHFSLGACVHFLLRAIDVAVEHIVHVPAPQLQEDKCAGPARSTRTYFHAH